VDTSGGDPDRHPVERRYRVGRRVVVIGRADDLAASTAARTSVPADVETAEERLPDVRRGRPTGMVRTMSSALVVSGLIGLLGVCGAAASVVHDVTGPARHAVRVLQAPGTDRRSHRRRSISPSGLRTTTRAVACAGVVSAPAEQVPVVPVVPADVRDIARDPGELGQVATVTVADVGTAGPAPSPVATTRYAAARSRALGPTTALWHAVQLDRLVGAIDGACEVTVCGSLVRVSTEQTWPVPARDVCPACSTLAH
jgi:hypothetical protein